MNAYVMVKLSAELVNIFKKKRSRRPEAGTFVGNHKPANTTRWPIAGLVLVQRRRRWTSISPELGQRVVFAGLASTSISAYAQKSDPQVVIFAVRKRKILINEYICFFYFLEWVMSVHRKAGLPGKG